MSHPAFEEFDRVVAALGADVHSADTLHVTAPSDFTARTLVKTCFTFLEGHLYAFKQTVLSLEYVLNPFGGLIPRARESRIVLFTEAEKAMLKEFTYDLRGTEA